MTDLLIILNNELVRELLVRELLRIDPGISVILCTGFREKMDEEKANSLGISGVLFKPVAIRDFAEMVRNILDKRAAR